MPPGFTIKDTAFGDLNNDKKTDVVLIFYQTKEADTDFENTAMNIDRPLMVLLQLTNGKLQLAKRNEYIIMCKKCGGIMGDPYASVTIKNNAFFLEFYGGSNWRWGNTFGFSWNPVLQSWQLIKESHISFQSGDPQATMKKVNIPSSEISRWNIDNFNINKLYEKQEVKGRVISNKSYFYNEPNVATKRKAYVTIGDMLYIVRQYNTFYEVFFTNAKQKSSTGYVLKKQI